MELKPKYENSRFNETQELKLRKYFYLILKEHITRPLNTVEPELVDSYLRNLVEDMFHYTDSL